jgi:putative membrane protein
MMDWYGGMGWGGWLIACLMMLAFLALVAVVVFIGLASGFRGISGISRPTAKDILDDRLARGEIDIEEYTRDLDVLRSGEGRPHVQ